MAESNFGIMELLQKLLKERGTGVSDKEMGIMSGGKDIGKTGSGYQSWLDKNRFDRDKTSNYTPNEMQTLDPLANTRPYSNPTTPALNKMRGLQKGGKYGGNYYAGTGGQDLLFRNPDPFNANPNQFVNPPPEKFWNDGTLSNDPNMLQPLGAVSQRETEAMKRSMLADVGMQSFGNPSDLDVSFAQALSGLTPREQAEIISATQGYNDAQVENFKRQYLQGRVSPYELEAQSNLGF